MRQMQRDRVDIRAQADIVSIDAADTNAFAYREYGELFRVTNEPNFFDHGPDAPFF